MPSKDHWENVYASKSAEAVSWYQPHALQSLNLIRNSGTGTASHIIDIGGGASTLTDDLLALGYRHLNVLDLSGEALAVARKRLGSSASLVNWIEGDITTVELPEHRYDIWHDRAVFHFLTDPAAREAYLAQVMKAVKPGGHVIVATFAPDGPTQCSGLPIMRYSPESLHAEFGQAFELIEHVEENHVTPHGNVQHFIYCHCIKPSLPDRSQHANR